MTSKEYEHLLEVRKNIFLSKEDPEFLRKYVKYRPTDGQKLYEYALEWKTKGHEKNYLTYLSKAAKQGSYQAEKLLNEEGKQSSFKKTIAPPQSFRILGLYVWMILLCLLFMLILLLCGIYFFQKYLHYYEVEHHYYKNEKTVIHEANASPLSQPSTSPTYTDKDVQHMVLKNAIIRFYEANGFYPDSDQTLIQDAPNNWISVIPADLTYTPKSNGFELTDEGSTPMTDKDLPLFELHLYPDTHQLALVTTEGEILTLYDVANGVTPLPFTKSKVTMRVIKPNGGEGALGSRGLALHNHYAIHGTDEPSSIGKSVSKGCIRMNNEEIERLFTYVSLGTPFQVRSGEPKPPVFKEGLPRLVNPSMVSNVQENYPSRQFNWYH